ncbi:50S ribosomal protein L16 3-hydroxylase [Litorivivens lipolytica]|uniref:50S ribosomal protein L16 3-hydroxylase n=1 Tax=Litorivivens lipolytica TaxID=1524264 RepID=A0A7W4Z4T2_9GAMM|nr:cupin domain-containing protein [Litorivivens lipolytica]MBB3046412.1 50S ribosomal protein L16 3-hydroxylase [Litorivivens lipolytica]
MALAGFDRDTFLRDYWQKKPLLIRQGLPNYQCPIDGNDLAGLACEDDAEARLIAGRDTVWQMRNGPFNEDDFNDLPVTDWTLLVQRVDHWVEDIAALAGHFDFLPQWRIEDIMVSYAVSGGGVGPHFDRYDVFLVQGSGRREWRIGQQCDDSDDLMADQPLRLLHEFKECDRYVLEPGDILYIPPGVAHWGTALDDDCITLSVGFRAPSVAQILERWWDTLSSVLSEDQRYRDVEATLAAGNLLTAEHIEQLQALLQPVLNDGELLIQSFGELVTEPAGDYLPQSSPREVPSTDVARALDSRITVYCSDGSNILFSNGMSLRVNAASAPLLADICQCVPGGVLPTTLWTELLKASPEAASFLLSTGALLADAD